MPTTYRLALATLITLPGVALGQGFSRPPGMSPTITPAMIRPAWTPAPFGGVRPFTPGYATRFGGPFLVPSYLGGTGYGVYSGFDPYYSAPFFTAVEVPISAPLVASPGFIHDGPTADAPVPAELTLDFPADATVTVEGKPDPGTGPAHTLTTRPLKVGETATLAVRAVWSSGGTRYEWARTVTLGRGERSRLTVVSGVVVK